MSKRLPEKFYPKLYVDAIVAGPRRFASDGKLLLEWKETHWSSVDDDDAEKEAFRWLADHFAYSAGKRNARAAVDALRLSAEPVPRVTADAVIPTLTGYVHVDERGALALRPADRALGLRHCLRCAYDPTAEAPRFVKFLERVLPDGAVRRRVQEYVGYSLLGDARYQRAQMWIGTGANGKGVLANIVQALHGRVAAVALVQLDGFMLSSLVDASLVYVDEIPRKHIDEQRLKSMIAGERVSINRKYRDPLSIHVQAKWLILGNQLPIITDHSVGFWRRWDVVPFGETIPEAERIPNLAQHITRDELSGVLNWALEGLTRVLHRGGFDQHLPDAMTRTRREAQVETNSVAAWADDLGVALQVPCDRAKSGVFESYRIWCGANAMREVSVVQFWKRVRELFPEFEETRLRQSGTPRRLCNVHVPCGEPRAAAGALL
jgi:putative DNA primase/helicase